MKQEEKELLLKDLCARLCYGVMLSTPNGNKPLLALVSSKKYNTIIAYEDYCGNENNVDEWLGGDVEFIKPYLRPMSSMTEEEYKEYKGWIDAVHNDPAIQSDGYFDWLNRKMFDYRGLIPRGLALKSPKGMYELELNELLEK